MAGTRRRSRAGDTANTHRPQRSESHATSVVETITEAPEVVKPAETPESTEDGPSRPDSPVNRATKGFCRKCKSNLGEFYNSWHKVTGSYYVPTLLGSYSSLLKKSGKQKAASRGTAIEGSTIQPLSCPDPNCADLVGFTVIQGKAEFRGRDFFKLNHIELRCEVSPNETTVVEPLEETTPTFLKIEDLDSPSPPHLREYTAPAAQATDAMEIDTRPTPTQHSGSHHVIAGQHHERHQLHQPLQQMEGNRQPLPPPASIRSPPTLAPLQSVPPKAPSNPLPSLSPAVRPVHDTSYSTQPSPRESSAGLTARRDFPPVASRLHSPGDGLSSNGNAYPRSPGDVSLDAIERLQTQISQNSGALAAHTRDIRRGEESFQQLEASLRREFAAQVQHQSIDIQRVDEAVARLHLEMQGMRQALEGFSHELAISRAEMQQRAVATPSVPPAAVPDAAIEMMAQQVAVITHKTAELDNLKITIEIMKKKIHHLEQGAATSAPQLKSHVFQPSQSSVPPQPHTTVAFHTPGPVTRPSPPVQTPSNPQTYQSLAPPSSTISEAAHRLEPTPTQSSGWASINAGTKRSHMNGVNSPQEGALHEPGSPKRQKVADHAHHSYVSSPRFENKDAERSDPAIHTTPPTVPTQHTIPESTPVSQSQHSTYAPYGAQDVTSDENWRSEPQRTIEHRPRGRPRGSGGPGSRGGRVRKSLPVQPHQLGTPEWERDDWQAVSESQAGPDGYYNHVARPGRGIARRGSGGGGRGGYAQSDRAASLGSQGVSPGFGIGSPNDPYAHTKKTRTKPIRNADGVLIRKDGRPDMRSQSSAANLRKVHARKEGDQSAQGSPTGFTPTNLHYATSADAPDTPSPSGYADQDVPNSVQRKHSAIMGKMFPKGVDESRKEHDYAHQVFEEDRGQTARPRTQHRHHDAHQRRMATDLKEDHSDRRERTGSQTSNEDDVDMERMDDQDGTDVEEQTPGQRNEQYHDAHTEVQPESQPTQDTEERVVPETQAVEPPTLASEAQ